MENGTIDAAEYLSPYDDERLGLAKVAKYNYYPCWWESGGMVHMLVNLEKWNELPKAYRAILARACDAANAWMLARYDWANCVAFKRLTAAGAIVRPFQQPIMDAFYRAANEHFAELSAKEPQFKRALESANAFRKDNIPWWQVSEHAFNGYLISARGRV
jgi:TRAP-type mannitol/chloroaromatic compound transport system substrate-binding protein